MGVRGTVQRWCCGQLLLLPGPHCQGKRSTREPTGQPGGVKIYYFYTPQSSEEQPESFDLYQPGRGEGGGETNCKLIQRNDTYEKRGRRMRGGGGGGGGGVLLDLIESCH